MDASEHFKTDFSHQPEADGRFVRIADITPVQYVEGLSFQPVLGEQTLANFVTYEPHTEAPLHSHVEEQVVVILDGELEFLIGDELRVMRPGDVAVIPPWVPHRARTYEGTCRQIDFFSPPRDNLVEYARGVRDKLTGQA
ncbi:cupin domain-containing protein [Kribbella italica]|uniref:Quercetin dioxygenase-like cupin family protein n=1 Tax=Kribbella italica TaxID=1540520 RepID=A0A7W9J4N4_9ACTN|nr:cupin domain-containing protein [Kribbella italica]MBB5835478.1 quercetin dioxygenase-like cupin family protein [Kribbella italica]